MERVLELGGLAAGFAGRLFAGSGHDVVRVPMPALAPAWVSDRALEVYLHTGKRRVDTRDAALIAELAASADIVIAEAPCARSLGSLGFDDWSARVRVAITPFGRSGPRRDWQATPASLLAMSGHSALMGDPGREPLTLPGHFLEFQSGAYAFTAAMACRLDGRAEQLDISQLEVGLALHQFTHAIWQCGGGERVRRGSDPFVVSPANQYRCRDGWVVFHVPPRFWDAFVVMLQRPELLLDPRFVDAPARAHNHAELDSIIEGIVAERSRAELVSRAAECRLPCGAVASLEEVLADARLEQRGFWQLHQAENGPPLRSPRSAVTQRPVATSPGEGPPIQSSGWDPAHG